MKIYELIERLEMYPQDTTIYGVDLTDYGSERGSYDRFYIGKNSESTCTIGGLISFFRSKVIGETFEGYKGGDFYMDGDTAILLANYGYCGDFIVDIKNIENGIEFHSIDSWDVY